MSAVEGHWNYMKELMQSLKQKEQRPGDAWKLIDYGSNIVHAYADGGILQIQSWDMYQAERALKSCSES